MKRYIIDNNKIYYANCKKVGDKYELTNKEVKDVTMNVLTVAKDYLEYIAKANGIENDPMVVFNDNTALILKRLVQQTQKTQTNETVQK